MISTSDFKKGTKILYKGEPYVILDYRWVKPGKGGAYIRTKMKNMISGLIHEETFRSGEKLERADLEYKDMQYLYEDGGMYHFLDQKTYEQVTLNNEQLLDVKNFLKEEIIYNILYFQGIPIAVAPPLFIELKVIETQPGVRGDTAQGGATKPATLETGLVVQLPLFVNEGEMVKIDTRDASYVERV